MQNKKLILNSISAIIQVIIVGIIYLLLYKYLLQTIGIELLGVWSLIIATTSLALIANFGISTSIIKFVATYHTRGDFEKLKKLIFTSSVFIIVTYSIISVLLLFLGNIILSYFIEPNYLSIALEILPYSLISLIINALGGVISSCLDGIQKNYIRSYIISFSSILLFILSLLLTPEYGLKGLIFAQIFQALIVLLVSFYFISKNIEGILSFKWNWSREIFKEIIDYGLKMQALSFMQMSFEPVTKAFLSKFGGIAMVGYYEMASRLVSQFRSLIVNANQVVIPVVAQAKESNKNYVKDLYIKSFSIVFLLDILLISGIIITVPLVSKLWIGEIVPFFIFSVILNCVVVFVNILSNPAYFSYLGEGKLNWLIYSYGAIMTVNIIASYFLGIFLEGYGVVIAWNIAFLIGSLLTIFSYQNTNNIKWKELFTRNDILMLFFSIVLCYSGYQSLLKYCEGRLNSILICIFILSTIIFVKYFFKNKNIIFVIAEMKKLLVKRK